MSTENPEQEIIFEFTPVNTETAELIKESFRDDELLQSSAFGGIGLFTIIAAAMPVIRKAFAFYKEYRTSLKNAKIKIGGKEISFEGFSAAEINAMVEKGTIQKLQEKLEQK